MAKYAERAFVNSKKANKHTLLAPCVNCTVRGEGEIHFGSVYVPLPRKSSIAKPYDT